MLSNFEPGESYDAPTQVGSALVAIVQEWRYDTEGTRYRVILTWTPSTNRLLVAVEPDKHLGRTWYALDWRPGAYLAADYVQQHWRTRPGDDTRALTELLAAAMQRIAINTEVNGDDDDGKAGAQAAAGADHGAGEDGLGSQAPL